MTSRLAAVAAAALVLALPGCGDSGALNGLSEAQRDQVAAAWEAQIRATDTTQVPVAERNQRVTALYGACAKLDRSVPLASALADACKPIAISTKLGAVLPERCASPSSSCVRALDRISETTETLATALAGLTAAAAPAIESPECRSEFSTTETQLSAYGDLAQAYRVLAAGVEREDKDISGLGQRRIDDARGLITPTGTVDQRLQRFRDACGVGD